MVHVLPRVTSAQRKTGCAKRNFSVQRPFPVCESMPKTTWVQELGPTPHPGYKLTLNTLPACTPLFLELSL